MKKNYGPQTWLYPMPVFIISSYDEFGNANAMNAAWGGTYDTNMITICLGNDHKSTENIVKNKAFCVHMGTEKYLKECDYLGIASGKKVSNKLEKCGFTVSKSSFVNAPIINELPMVLECEMVSYNSETCQLIGNILNVSIDEEVLDENGKVDVNKLRPISYDPVSHNYITVSSIVGRAFKDGLEIK